MTGCKLLKTIFRKSSRWSKFIQNHFWKQSVRGVLKNRFLEFAVEMLEKYLWRSLFLTFSCIRGFYLIKKFVKIVFFVSFFLRQKLLETGLCNFTKKGTSSKIFFKDFDWKFPLATFRTAVYKNIFFSRTSLWLLPNFV